jgi:type IV secretion system protein VirB2
VIEHVRRGFAALIAAGALLWSGAASAQDSLSDPAGSGAIVAAVQWLQGTLLGTIATVVAVIAVASVGFMMLTGRINWRYGATVIVGCFILFGAASIASGIQASMSGPEASAAPYVPPPPSLPPTPPAPPPANPDPYAGAAVPSR